MRTSTSDTAYVYGLRCKGAAFFRYIGISNSPKMRLKQHLNDPDETRKTKWIRQSMKRGREIEMVILCECSRDLAFVIEATLVKSFRAVGYDLLNGYMAGDRRCVTSVRAHPLLVDAVERYAKRNDRTVSYVINRALCEMFRDELPPGFQPERGMEE